jgi:hypothetical protein
MAQEDVSFALNVIDYYVAHMIEELALRLRVRQPGGSPSYRSGSTP